MESKSEVNDIISNTAYRLPSSYTASEFLPAQVVKELPDKILSNFPQIKTNIIPTKSFQIKIPSDDSENMEQCLTIMKKIKRDDVSHDQIKLLNDKDELNLQLPPFK